MDLWVKPVILNPSTVTPGPSHVILNPSDPVILSPSHVILNEVKNLRAGSAKDLILLRVDSTKSLRTSSVKDLRSPRDSSPEPVLSLSKGLP
ncbi:MAG: hypothetical protein HW395_821 [candidate division NC10 bacterium]|nr:hypothetical protein [candidate division NC10 bacterium]